jgi:hypothetical protein
MDPKHREELETNDLADFFQNFGQWWKKHGNRLLTVILLIVLALTAWRFYTVRQETIREGNWSELASLTGAPEFRGLADQTSDPAVRTLALLQAADLLRIHNAAAQAAPESPAASDAAASTAATASTASASPTLAIDTPRTQREQHLLEAKALYQRVIDEAFAPVYVCNAKLGLAAVLQTLGDHDGAAQLYHALAADAKDAFPLIAAQARANLAILDRLQSPIAFAPEASVTTPPALDPTTAAPSTSTSTSTPTPAPADQ